ncbi:PTS sugar transporter subunit IIA [Enterobacter cloacae subsp. cloacae]|nr:PTS sugar transporter subunit IIA [Enterobacter cloacae subsp. cloacae]
MGTGIGNGIAILHGKLEEDTLRAVGVFVQLETPYHLMPSITSPLIPFALLVPADQTKTHLVYAFHWSNAPPIKPSVADCAQRKVMKSFMKLSLKQKAVRMRHNQEMAFTSVVLRRETGTWC